MRAFNVGTVEVLLNAGADVNVVDNYGYTALMPAISDATVGKAQTLINSGADVNVKTRDGITALKIATKNGLSRVVDLLRWAGAME